MNEELKMVMDTLISEMGKMETRITKRLDQHDKCFEAIDKRFEAIDKRFEAIDRRFEKMEKRFRAMDRRMDCAEKDMKMYVNALVDEMGRMEMRMNKRFEKVDKRFDHMDARLDAMQHEINGCKLACDTVSLLMQRIDQHESRIERLEKKSGIGKILPVGN